MKTWKRWIARICHMEKEVFKGNLDTEEILRVKNRRILELEQQVAELKSRLWHPRLVHVEIDQAGQKQAQAQIGGYEMPAEKRTDPAQFGIRRRATMRTFQEHPGKLMNHHKEMATKKAQTGKLDPQTMMLGSVTAPEDDWTNGGADKTARHKAVNQ